MQQKMYCFTCGGRRKVGQSRLFSKRAIKRENGLKGTLWDDHFLGAVWMWQPIKEAKLYLQWKEFARQYSRVE
ncbi:hypothetical protein TELCIR_15321 [Teladorsagia circumcincta]|uniref:Uncharacterized protein n=1 Tax=Teladorsagia circumcincta TaxID=45464 RepID=A0A2G9TYJ8_TELCI|nr:hypothetical protein TELCIR_15321 [Teladorsagia circumcincta]